MIRLAPLGELSTRHAAAFRFRAVGDRVIITNQEGRWLRSPATSSTRSPAIALDPTGPLYARLRDHNFLRDHYDVRAAAEMVRARKRFVHHGPNLHMAVVTLRCNETCVYCHASRADMEAVHTDMTREVAEQTVDFIFKTTSPFVTIEFQGGEPLVNFPVVQHLIEYALDKNRAAGKQLEFTMVSNLALMDDAKLEYLLGKKVQLCTSIDGPAPLHDKQRVLPMASSLRPRRAVDQAHQRRLRRRRPRPDAVPRRGAAHDHARDPAAVEGGGRHLRRARLPRAVPAPARSVRLRRQDRAQDRVPAREYLEFYRRAVDYMIELNAGGAPRSSSATRRSS
jgi:uncharacterized protein